MNDAKKKKALTILVSWLESTKTPHQVKLGDGRVDILIGETPFYVTEDVAVDLTGSIDTALPAFWEITERAGLGRPRPAFRPQHVGSLLPREDVDLVAMRHTEFRRVPNNPAVFLREDYQKIASWAVSRFYRFNRTQLKQLGYETEDLKTFAWLYIMNFHGLWRDIKADDKKNGGALCNYLQQRFFTDFRKLIDRKSQNVLVDIETMSLAMNIEVVPQWDKGEALRGVAAVAIDKEEYIHDDFEHLPIKIKVGKLVGLMRTRQPTEIKLEAEEKLMGLGFKNLDQSTKKEIQKFHRQHLPRMTKEERALHRSTCCKCSLRGVVP